MAHCDDGTGAVPKHHRTAPRSPRIGSRRTARRLSPARDQSCCPRRPESLDETVNVARLSVRDEHPVRSIGAAAQE